VALLEEKDLLRGQIVEKMRYSRNKSTLIYTGMHGISRNVSIPGSRPPLILMFGEEVTFQPLLCPSLERRLRDHPPRAKKELRLPTCFSLLSRAR
jgi:hypothetical protein